MIELNVQAMSRNVKAVQNASKELRAMLVGEETMLDIAEQAKTMVQKRTGEGRDADGKNFASYTGPYAAKRAKTGRSLIPNLTWSGGMLGNIHSKFIEPGRAMLLFLSTEESNKAAGNSHKRDFFDIRLPEETSILLRILDRRVNKIIRQLGLA